MISTVSVHERRTNLESPDSPFRTEAGIRISERAADLVPLLQRRARDAERAGALTEDVLAELNEAGIFDLGTPEELGGHALGARDLVDIMIQLGRGDGSASWLAATASGNHVMVHVFPQRAIEEIWKPGEQHQGFQVVGASVFATKVGKATKVDGGWLVQGKWGFGTGCRHASWGIVGVDYDDNGRIGRGQVLLSRDQFTIVDDWDVMGLTATSSNSIAVTEETFVADHRFVDMADLGRLMGELGTRFGGAAFAWGPQARILAMVLCTSSNALGMAIAALDAFAEQAVTKKPFNLPYSSVAEMPSTQVAAGKARAMISQARNTIYSYADEVERRTWDGADFSEAEAAKLQMDLVFGIRLCSEAVDLLQYSLGSSTVSKKNIIQRCVRDLRVLSTHGAIRFEPMAEINGREILGLPEFPMFAGGLPAVG